MPVISLEKVLENLGIDLNDPNFKDTPTRMLNAFRDMAVPDQIVQNQCDFFLKKVFPTNYEGIILFPRIKAKSLCPHHMLPIEYEIVVAYIPEQRKPIESKNIISKKKPTQVLGLSKIVRIVRALCNRAVLQEDLTCEIAKVFEKINAAGAAVVTKGWHGCMTCRGVMTDDPVVMSEMIGAFKENISSRNEFFELLKYGRELH